MKLQPLKMAIKNHHIFNDSIPYSCNNTVCFPHFNTYIACLHYHMKTWKHIFITVTLRNSDNSSNRSDKCKHSCLTSITMTVFHPRPYKEATSHNTFNILHTYHIIHGHMYLWKYYLDISGWAPKQWWWQKHSTGIDSKNSIDRLPGNHSVCHAIR